MPVTEIWYTRIDPSESLASHTSGTGKTWTVLLDLVEQSDGFLEQTWSRGYEEPTAVRLHIVRNTLEQHKAFHESDSGRLFKMSLQSLMESGPELQAHHVVLETVTGSPLSAPFTGTALYLSTNEVFTDLVWPLWTHIVRHVPGCIGVMSGKVLDHKSGHEAFLVYVGWESLELHSAYWEDPGLDDKRGILDMGNRGRTEFYHVVFNNRTPT